jgi:hypothetical protein
VQNLSMSDDLATKMRADVFHWAQAGTACKLKPPPEEMGPPLPPVKAKVKKSLTKPSAAAKPPVAVPPLAEKAAETGGEKVAVPPMAGATAAP